MLSRKPAQMGQLNLCIFMGYLFTTEYTRGKQDFARQLPKLVIKAMKASMLTRHGKEQATKARENKIGVPCETGDGARELPRRTEVFSSDARTLMDSCRHGVWRWYSYGRDIHWI